MTCAQKCCQIQIPRCIHPQTPRNTTSSVFSTCCRSYYFVLLICSSDILCSISCSWYIIVIIHESYSHVVKIIDQSGLSLSPWSFINQGTVMPFTYALNKFNQSLFHNKGPWQNFVKQNSVFILHTTIGMIMDISQIYMYIESRSEDFPFAILIVIIPLPIISHDPYLSSKSCISTKAPPLVTVRFNPLTKDFGWKLIHSSDSSRNRESRRMILIWLPKLSIHTFIKFFL